MVSERQQDVCGSVPTVSRLQILRGRQLKANQELKIRANELEKLFAEHKLRVPQSHDKNAATEPLTSSTNTSNLTVTPQVKVLDKQDPGDATMEKLSEFGLPGYCRGKLYESYRKKRDAKLREEWGSKKEEKEAKMKAMQDSFERSSAEIKAKLSSKSCEERSKSSNSRSTTAMEESKDEKDLFVGSGGSKSSQAKKPPNKNLPSSIQTPSAMPVLRSSTKTSNTSSVRGMLQPKNSPAHSVPNFSDLRKENPNPNSGVSKTVTRPPAKMHARSKSCIENIILVNEERKPRLSESLKIAKVPTELGIVKTPPKSDKSDRFSQNSVLKPYSKKGSSLVPGAGVAVAKMKGSMQSINENDQRSETTKTEDHVNKGNVKSRLSQESEKLVDSGSEGGDHALRSSSQVETSEAESASTFHTVGSVQNSPAGGPLLWNSCVQHAFSYANGTSDTDASPIAIPASCNSRSLNKVEAGSVQTRKKWSTAQKPSLVSNTSNGHSRKDVTGGFKKLLQFGRKSRGTDNMVDWISATISEGDNGKQGHPPKDKFNEIKYISKQVQSLRSSFPTSQVNHKLREQNLSRNAIKAPRSLFSLSSLRSKGSNSKPR